MKVLPPRDDQTRSLLDKIAELRSENNQLKKKLEEEQKKTTVFIDKVYGSFQVDDKKVVPNSIVKWMIEYSMPWQVFWCDKHNQWHTELDTSFPYHIEQNECDWCKKGR